jgi:hypothetical protein
MLIEIFKRSATSADVFTKSDQFANVYAFDIKERYIVMQLDSSNLETRYFRFAEQVEYRVHVART